MTGVSVALRIAADHPTLAGHFPGRPIVPGVLLLDEILHTIQSRHSGAAGDASWHVDVVKFHRAALPEQALQLDYQSQHDGVFRFELRADTGLIVSGTVLVSGTSIVRDMAATHTTAVRTPP